MNDTTNTTTTPAPAVEQPLTPEQARVRQIAAMIDDLGASASSVFTEARTEIDQIEQMVLISAAKAKSVLEDHIRVVLDSKSGIAQLRRQLEQTRADHARLVNAETGS